MWPDYFERKLTVLFLLYIRGVHFGDIPFMISIKDFNKVEVQDFYGIFDYINGVCEIIHC